MAMLVSVGLALAASLLAGAALIANRLSLPLFAIAFLLIIGMLVGTIRLQQGAGERAIFTLAGCWASILLLAAGCAVPMCESFRTSRVIGERLAVRSRQSGLEPVLLEYQEPGIIYALGHTVALTRDRDGYFAHLEGGRSVLTVLLQNEIEVMRDHFGLDVTPLEQIEGFWLTKGKYQSLYIAVVRQGRSRSTDELPAAMTACGAVLEQTLVK